MRIDISKKTFWDVYIYDWSGIKPVEKEEKSYKKQKDSKEEMLKHF